MNLEAFEITEANVVKRTKDVTLKKDKDTEWTWKPKKYNSDEGLYNHAQLVCNGKVFILNLPHRAYFFKMDDGVRFRVTKKRAEIKDYYQLVYDGETHTFSGFQVGVFQGF